MLAKVRSYLKSLLHPAQREEELTQEIQFHIDARAADLVRNGMSAADAQRQARLEFGGIATHRSDIRESIGMRWLDDLFADIRYGIRTLAHSKVFTAIAVISLALGIGANTIIFTMTKSVLLDRLDIPHAGQLRILATVPTKGEPSHGQWNGQISTNDGQPASASFSYPIYKQIVAQNRAAADSPLADIAGFQNAGINTITVNGHADIGIVQMVSGNYFQQMEIQPVLGRLITESDDASRSQVAVISNGLWLKAFDHSPDVIGKSFQLNLVTFTVIGIAPPGFTGAQSMQNSADIFVPISMQPILAPAHFADNDNGSLLASKKLWWVETFARLKPGATDAAATAAIQTWLDHAVRDTMPMTKDNVTPKAVLVDGSHGFVNKIHRGDGFSIYQSLYVLTGLAGFVLVLACANLANLLLARSAARQREISVRLALGASRGRILRQVLTESLLLSSLGGALGLVIAWFGRNVIPHIMGASWRPPTINAKFDAGILLFTLAISIATGLLFGLVPALQATRTQVNSNLKDSSASTTHRRKGLAGRSIVVFQIALSMVLVVGAGLFARTLVNLNAAPLGFNASQIIIFDMAAPEARYKATQAVDLLHRIEDRISRVPGVQQDSLMQIVPVSNSMITNGFYPTDRPKSEGARDYVADNAIGQNYFSVYGIPILYGRSFAESDTATSPQVAIINQALVDKFFRGKNPIGVTFTTGDDSPDHSVYQIIGVVPNTKYLNLREDPQPTIYTDYVQAKRMSWGSFAIKTSLPPDVILPQLRSAIAEIDKDLPLREIRTQKAQIAATVSQETLFATLTIAFGVLALILACIGIYGLMAYNVAQRTSEIGIRMALGAQAWQMLSMVLREATWMATIGVAAGLGCAFLLSKYIKSMLFGLTANNPLILCGACALLFFVALFSGWFPARRAASVQPMQALRHE